MSGNNNNTLWVLGSSIAVTLSVGISLQIIYVHADAHTHKSLLREKAPGRKSLKSPAGSTPPGQYSLAGQRQKGKRSHYEKEFDNTLN